MHAIIKTFQKLVDLNVPLSKKTPQIINQVWTELKIRPIIKGEISDHRMIQLLRIKAGLTAVQNASLLK